MKRHTTFHALFLSLLLVFAAVLCGCQTQNTDTLTLDFYKIGKADAIFLRGTDDDGTPFSVLIDTGEADDAPEITEKLRAAGVDTLDYLILTHFDKDHIGGLPTLLSEIPAAHILMPDYVGSGAPYDAMTALFADGTHPTQVLTEDTQFTCGNTHFSVSVPKQNVYAKKQDNNASLVITVTHGKQILYFAGDAEQLRQEELISELSAAGITKTALLKVPHHGVYNDGIDAFLAACAPQNAIITCSDKNPPDPETLSCLHALDAKTFLTADGDIRMVCTEDSITVTQ